MSEIKCVTLSLRTGDNIMEQLYKQHHIAEVFAVIDVKLLKILEFNATVEVQYQEDQEDQEDQE